jgi:hypothetical protein
VDRLPIRGRRLQRLGMATHDDLDDLLRQGTPLVCREALEKKRAKMIFTARNVEKTRKIRLNVLREQINMRRTF